MICECGTAKLQNGRSDLPQDYNSTNAVCSFRVWNLGSFPIPVRWNATPQSQALQVVEATLAGRRRVGEQRPLMLISGFPAKQAHGTLQRSLPVVAPSLTTYLVSGHVQDYYDWPWCCFPNHPRGYSVCPYGKLGRLSFSSRATVPMVLKEGRNRNTVSMVIFSRILQLQGGKSRRSRSLGVLGSRVVQLRTIKTYLSSPRRRHQAEAWNFGLLELVLQVAGVSLAKTLLGRS